MPVDRKNRDKLADALAAFMGREIDDAEMAQVMKEVAADQEQQQVADYDATLDRVLTELWLFETHGEPMSVDEEDWRLHEHFLTVLCSDLQLRVVRVSKVSGLPYIVVAVPFLVAISAAGMLAHRLDSAWVFWGPYFGLGVISHYLLERFWRTVANERRKHIADFAPFRDEEHWRRYAHLMSKYEVPKYNAAVHDASRRPQTGIDSPTIGRWAFSIFFGPLALMSLCMGSEKINRIEIVENGE